MAVTNIPISKQGYKRLEEELARLKSERPAIIQAIKEAVKKATCAKTPVMMPPANARAWRKRASSISSPAWLFTRWSTWTS